MEVKVLLQIPITAYKPSPNFPFSLLLGTYTRTHIAFVYVLSPMPQAKKSLGTFYLPLHHCLILFISCECQGFNCIIYKCRVVCWWTVMLSKLSLKKECTSLNKIFRKGLILPPLLLSCNNSKPIAPLSRWPSSP